MDISQRKEQFSQAFVRAVASTAGFAVYEPSVDDDSIDCGLAQRGGGGTVRSPKLDLQLKCGAKSSGGISIDDQKVTYRLKVKNYNDLRAPNCLVPRVLVVVLVPSNDLEHWLTESDESLTLNSSAFWVSLRGKSETSVAGDKVTVHLPRSQRFNVEQIQALMNQISEGQMP
ncbi:MAG: DUF4365 domain-containing protein [Planctomycetota bacterium]